MEIEGCGSYLLFHCEVFLSKGTRIFLYFAALFYCFIGLSAITGRFFRSMENIVKQTKEVKVVDPCTKTEVIKHEKVWNYTIADITLLAFGTSFPQISLATIDAVRNIGQLNAGDPLFIDPYAECLVSPLVFDHVPNCIISPVHYRLSTKFIDDKILHEISSTQELRQIVLLTDGMDTRPYRLNWPRQTVIYDISPENVFKEAYQRLQGNGAKVSKSAMMIHTSLESFDLQTLLPRKGFDGKRPSLCVLQGLPIITLDDFVGILSLVSSLAMKGCLFVGELPCWLLCTKHDDKLALQRWMEKLFLSNGFQVKVVNYDELARDVHNLPKAGPANVLFVAKQLKLSDAQMDAWRVHFERIEEEGDEEGFEEL